MMEVDWAVLPKGDLAPHSPGLYVKMNRQGSLVTSRFTHYLVLDAERVRISPRAHSQCRINP